VAFQLTLLILPFLRNPHSICFEHNQKLCQMADVGSLSQGI